MASLTTRAVYPGTSPQSGVRTPNLQTSPVSSTAAMTLAASVLISRQTMVSIPLGTSSWAVYTWTPLPAPVIRHSTYTMHKLIEYGRYGRTGMQSTERTRYMGQVRRSMVSSASCVPPPRTIYADRSHAPSSSKSKCDLKHYYWFWHSCS